jgi:hypothetical protein
VTTGVVPVGGSVAPARKGGVMHFETAEYETRDKVGYIIMNRPEKLKWGIPI